MEVKLTIDLEALFEHPRAQEIIKGIVISHLEDEANAPSADYIKDVVRDMINSGEITAEAEPTDIILSAN
jgi:hypothetical protein